jgi:DNA gyrase/topoisomerase IV subunit B
MKKALKSVKFVDGKGNPIQEHKADNIKTPEMIFGHLLTGFKFGNI